MPSLASQSRCWQQGGRDEMDKGREPILEYHQPIKVFNGKDDMRKDGTDECFVVDAGARYGLHPSWRLAESFARFDLYEAEPIEAERLTRKYANRSNLSIHQVALAEGPGELEFELRRHRALSSSFQMAEEAVDEEDKSDQFAAVATFTVRADSLDRIYPETDVHFLKLDV